MLYELDDYRCTVCSRPSEMCKCEDEELGGVGMEKVVYDHFKASTFDLYFKAIKELGLEIPDNNRPNDIVAHNDRAQQWVADSTLGETYVIGSVLAGTESLREAAYDIAFTCIENAYEMLGDDYDELHELAKELSFDEFRDNVYARHKAIYEDEAHERATVYSDMSEWMDDAVEDINRELEAIYVYLGGDFSECR